jgi:hypothetical protein
VQAGFARFRKSYNCTQHDDLIGIANNIELGHSRATLVTGLINSIPAPNPPNETERVNTSLNLTARLMCMITIGTFQYGFSGRPELEWTLGSLKGFIHGYFNGAIGVGHEKVKFEKIFNAKNLNRIAGIDIVWTDNLADHLRMMHDDTQVAVFSHASFLKHQSRLANLQIRSTAS